MPRNKNKQWLTPSQMSAIPLGWPTSVPYNPNSKEKPSLAGSKKKTRKRDALSKKVSKLPNEIVNEFAKICNNAKTPQLACRRLEELNFSSYTTTIWQTLFTGSYLNLASEIVTDEVTTLNMSIFNDKSKNLEDALYLVTHTVQRHKNMIVEMYDVLNTVVHIFCSKSKEKTNRIIKLLVHLRKHLGITLVNLVSHLYEQDPLVESGFALQFVFSTLSSICNGISRQNAIDSLEDDGIRHLIKLVPGPSKSYKRLFNHLSDHNIGFLKKSIVLCSKDYMLERVENELHSIFTDFTSVKNIVDRSTRLFDDFGLSKLEQIECLVPYILDPEKTTCIENIRSLSTYLEEVCNNSDLELHLLNICADKNYEHFIDICYALYVNDVLTEEVIVNWYNSDDANDCYHEAVHKIKRLITFFNEAETESDSE